MTIASDDKGGPSLTGTVQRLIAGAKGAIQQVSGQVFKPLGTEGKQTPIQQKKLKEQIKLTKKAAQLSWEEIRQHLEKHIREAIGKDFIRALKLNGLKTSRAQRQVRESTGKRQKIFLEIDEIESFPKVTIEGPMITAVS